MKSRMDVCEEKIAEARVLGERLKYLRYEPGPPESEDAAELGDALSEAEDLLDALADAADACIDSLRDIIMAAER